MIYQEREVAAEEADPDGHPERTDVERIAQLEAELRQAREQIAELQHLLKYRTVSKPPPLVPNEMPEAVPVASALVPVVEVPVVAPPARRVLWKSLDQKRQTILIVAGAGLMAGVLLGSVRGRSSGSKPESFAPPQQLAAAQLKTDSKPKLLQVSSGPIIAPGGAESAKPAETPPSAEAKKTAEEPVVKPKRHHRRRHKAPEGEPEKTPPMEMPTEPPDSSPPDPSPPDKESG